MSIKKCSLIAGATVVAVLAMASSALANNGASITTAKASPSTNITAGKPQPGGLFLDVTNCNNGDTTCTGSGGTNPTETSDGVNGIDVAWSGEILIAKPKIPVCAPANLAVPAKAAILACNGSVMGSGGATVCLGDGVTGHPCSAVQGNVTIFRGADIPVGGKPYPQLQLYADIPAIGAQAVIPTVLTPASKDQKALGFKTNLHVFGTGAHDPPPAVSQSITDFWANVNSGVKVKCGVQGAGPSSTNIQYMAAWDTTGGTKNDTESQNCSYVP